MKPNTIRRHCRAMLVRWQNDVIMHEELFGKRDLTKDFSEQGEVQRNLLTAIEHLKATIGLSDEALLLRDYKNPWDVILG